MMKTDNAQSIAKEASQFASPCEGSPKKATAPVVSTRGLPPCLSKLGRSGLRFLLAMEMWRVPQKRTLQELLAYLSDLAKAMA